MKTRPGRVLNDRYTLSAHIATGGMGEVWRAHDELLGRDVAVKVLRHEFAQHDGFLRRFRDEARHTASLSHPGIAAVYDYGEQDGSPYLVMELIDGEPLSATLARIGPIPLDRALRILADTADALHAAHHRGVVHRDVKPGNLMVTDDGRVKVTDFGIARAIGAAPITATGEMLGTAHYISPEQAAGELATPASDVYALGVVAYEVLTGQRPFAADTPIGLAMAHVRQPPPPLPSTLPSEVATIVMQALSKAPAERPADAATMAAQLRAASERTAVLPQPPAPRAPARRAAWLASLAVAAAVVVSVTLLRGGERESGSATSLPDAPPASTTVAPTSSAPTTTPAPTTAPATSAPTTAPATQQIVVDPAAYVGRKSGQVRSDLEELDLVVVSEPVPAGDARPDTVVDVTPSGELRPGDTVTIHVAEKSKGPKGKDRGDEDD